MSQQTISKEAPAEMASSLESRKSATPTSLIFDKRGRSIAWMMRTLHRLYNIHTQKILDRQDLTIAHWYYLRVLAERGSLNQLELSKRVGMAATTAVPALDRLEKRGLVKRTRDPHDRRKYFVSLTDEGRRLIDELLPDIVPIIEASLAGIPPDDIKTFWRVMNQILDNLAAEDESEALLD